MKSFILSFLFLLLLMPSATAQDYRRKEVLDSINSLIIAEDYAAAEKLIKDNIEMMSDSGAYDFLPYYCHGAMLYTEEKYHDAMDTMALAVRDLDEHIEEVYSSWQYIMVRPYYLYAKLALITESKDSIEALLHAEEVYRKAGFSYNNDYHDIVHEMGQRGAYSDDIYVALINMALHWVQSLDDSPLYYGMKAKFYYQVGVCYSNLDDLINAEQSYIKAWNYASALDDTTSVKRHIASELGRFYYTTIRDYKKALIYLEQAKDLFELNKDVGIEYVRLLSELGKAADNLQEPLKAIKYLNAAYDIMMLDTCEENKDDLSSLLCSISYAYCDMGDMHHAFITAFKAKDIIEEYNLTIEQQSIELLISILYAKLGNYNELQTFCENCLNSADSTQYKDPSLFALLAMTRFINGDLSYAELSREASLRSRDKVISKFTFLSEEQRMNYWGRVSTSVYSLNAILSYSPSEDNNITILENALFSKGLLLRTSNWIKEKIRTTASEEDINKLRERESISEKLSAGILPADSVAYYEDRLYILDKELSRSNVTYAELRNSLLVDWEEIAACLGKDEMAIEFVELADIDTFTLDFTNSNYAAIVVTKGCKYPEIIDLCGKSELEAILTNSNKQNTDKFVNNLYAPRLKGNGKDLYALVWQPLEECTAKARTIYYSPIGKLNSVAFGAVTHEGEMIGDKHDMRLVSSIANVIDIKKEEANLPQTALVYGGIKYDADEEELLAQARSYSSTRGESVALADDGQTRSGWAYLQDTEKEAEGVAERLESKSVQTYVYMGTSANEESFKALDGNSPELLHIATHGFFLSDPKDVETNIFLQTIMNKGSHTTWDVQEMNRSGLLFAGGNRAWTGKDIIDGIDDGILTAQEISMLNLSQTDLVVLSACETGLGTDISSEGIFGLQRAFKLAGVNTLIMSLWKVPDEETSMLMLSFYDNWLSGMSKRDAFRKAQDYVRSIKSNPYYWAAFVMLD